MKGEGLGQKTGCVMAEGEGFTDVAECDKEKDGCLIGDEKRFIAVRGS